MEEILSDMINQYNHGCQMNQKITAIKKYCLMSMQKYYTGQLSYWQEAVAADLIPTFPVI